MPIGGKKVQELLRNTDQNRIHRATNVKYRHLTTVILKNKNIRDYVYKTWTGAMGYQTTVRALYYENIRRNSIERNEVIVSCSCPDFKFRLEKALYDHNAANIKYCNNEKAIHTNPTNTPYFCKHIVAVIADVVMKNRRDIQKQKDFRKKEEYKIKQKDLLINKEKEKEKQVLPDKEEKTQSTETLGVIPPIKSIKSTPTS